MPEEDRAAGGIWRFGSGFDDAEPAPVGPEHSTSGTRDEPLPEDSAIAKSGPSRNPAPHESLPAAHQNDDSPPWLPSAAAGVEASEGNPNEATRADVTGRAPSESAEGSVEPDQNTPGWLLSPAASPGLTASVPAPAPAQSESSARRSKIPVIVAGVLILGLAAGGGIGWAVSRSGNSSVSTLGTEPARGDQAGIDQATTEPASPSLASASPEITFSPSPTPSTPSRAQLQREAVQTMEQLADEGLADHELDRQWVAQIASKWVGIRDPLQLTRSGSHTFAATDVLAEHLALKNGDNFGAEVFLLRGTDFGTGGRSDGKLVWTTFADGGFSSRQEAQDWCELRFPQLTGRHLENQCLPNRLRPLGG